VIDPTLSGTSGLVNSREKSSPFAFQCSTSFALVEHLHLPVASHAGPVLRKRFVGQPEPASSTTSSSSPRKWRDAMAELAIGRFDEMVGQMQMLDKRKLVEHWKRRARFLTAVHQAGGAGKRRHLSQRNADHHLEHILDRTLIEQARAAIDAAHRSRSRCRSRA